MSQPADILEATKADFSVSEILHAQELSWKAIQEMSTRIKVGVTEERANQIAFEVIRELGGEKNWHRPHVRFGENTLLSFRGVSAPTALRENDIYFIDIGPVFGGYEGDVGDTFVVGNDPEMHRCAEDCRKLFGTVRDRWRERVSGEALYSYAETEAERLGWKLNLDASGHRVSDFPHHLYYKGSMREVSFSPSPHLWILEIQIRHPTRPFGAFFEDLLV